MKAKTLSELAKDPNWPYSWIGMIERIIRDLFPSEKYFNESIWASWILRIREGEKKDEAYLAERYKDLDEFLREDL